MVTFDVSKLFSGNIAQIIAAVTGTLTALSDGMQYGWSAPIVPILKSPSSPVVITDSDVVWIENLYMLGGVAGLPLTIFFLDKFGRKKSMLIAAIVNLIAWLLIIFASSSNIILIARFTTGLAADCNFVATPMYIAEISDKKIRGRLGSLIHIMMMTGVLVIYSIGPFLSIATSSCVGLAAIVTELLTFTFMPESPYYLLVKNKREEARRSLQILRSSECVDKELEEIAQVIDEENTLRGRPLELLTVKSNRKALIIMTVLNFAQHYSSLSVILMNIHTILIDAATIIPASTAAILFSFLMLMTNIICAFLIDKIGRKALLNLSSFSTGISLLVLATYFAVKNNGTDVTSYSWVPVLAVMSYAVSFKSGLGLIPIVMTAELFPTNIKAFGCTVADAMYVISGASSIYLFHFLQKNYGMHIPFFLFGCCCLLTGIFSISFIPETKGKTLGEIQKLLKGEVNGDIRTHLIFEKVPLLNSCEYLQYDSTANRHCKSVDMECRKGNTI